MSLGKSYVVARYTFKELLKSKILFNVGFIGMGLVLAIVVATEFTYGVPERVAVDIGFGMLSLSSLGISLFLGVSLLSKELDSRTVYMIVSRPVSRNSFILGKISGLMAIQVINVSLLSTLTLTSCYLLGGEIKGLHFWAVAFTLLESLLLLLVVAFISLVANNVLTIIVSVSILLLGHAIKDTQSISFVKNNPVLVQILDVYHFFLPAFYKLNFKEFLIYERSLPSSYLLGAFTYGICYASAILFLILSVFNRKNLD